MSKQSPKNRRHRDYKAEYQRRVDRGIGAGKSRSAARGHARAEDLGPLPLQKPDRESSYEKALKSLKHGWTLKRASKHFGISQEKLRLFVKRHTSAEFRRGKWVIFDVRPQAVWLPIDGKLQGVTVAYDDTSEVGKYWGAVNKFIETNDVDHLFPFEGDGVRDINGRYVPFETRPNILRKLESIGELNFIEIYADVAK